MASVQFDALINKINDVEGIYAGLPWFFQFWGRDESISTVGLLQEERYAENEIIFTTMAYV